MTWETKKMAQQTNPSPQPTTPLLAMNDTITTTKKRGSRLRKSFRCSDLITNFIVVAAGCFRRIFETCAMSLLLP